MEVSLIRNFLEDLQRQHFMGLGNMAPLVI